MPQALLVQFLVRNNLTHTSKNNHRVKDSTKDLTVIGDSSLEEEEVAEDAIEVAQVASVVMVDLVVLVDLKEDNTGKMLLITG